MEQPTKYMLTRMRGPRAGWQAKVRGLPTIGWGSTADLAIRDWAKQRKLALKHGEAQKGKEQ